MAEKRCPQCGCTSFHYNPRHMKIVCNMCGYAIDNEQEQQRHQAYDHRFYEAAQNMRVGNYDTALSMLNALKSQYVAEARIYQTIQQAASEDFHLGADDLSADKMSVMADSWDKLMRLNGMTGQIRRYGYKVHAARIEKLQKKRKICCLFLAICFVYFIGIFVLGGGMGRPGMAFLSFIGFCYAAVKTYYMNPKQTKKELERLKSSKNPYI